jgi:blocked-early-in-transport protein 1
MLSRNPYSSLNHRPSPAASSLFSDYPGAQSQNPRSRPQSSQGYGAYADSPYSQSPANGRLSPPVSGFRPATPNSRGQYATSVLESLESQNDTTATTLLSQKVGQLKQLTIAIGDEIRDSSSLAQTINDQFEGTGVKLRGTMRRMLRMAERTGVGWKVWVGFFIFVWGLFAWVWLF